MRRLVVQVDGNTLFREEGVISETLMDLLKEWEAAESDQKDDVAKKVGKLGAITNGLLVGLCFPVDNNVAFARRRPVPAALAFDANVWAPPMNQTCTHALA